NRRCVSLFNAECIKEKKPHGLVEVWPACLSTERTGSRLANRLLDRRALTNRVFEKPAKEPATNMGITSQETSGTKEVHRTRE
ncbi:MAG: hypothetical protein AABX62_01340, partial [Thermoproteota archaeon]